MQELKCRGVKSPTQGHPVVGSKTIEQEARQTLPSAKGAPGPLGQERLHGEKNVSVDLEGPVGQEHQARVSIGRGSSIRGPFCLGLTLL